MSRPDCVSPASWCCSFYPVITLYLYVLGPVTVGWQMWQRTIILVPLMVLTIVFAVSPAINRYFGRFIAGGNRAG